jgi:hypothetical protein
VDEIYVSTDVEADGPIPGPHSMLSVGSAAYRGDKTLVGTFSANLETLEGATTDPDTMAWWETQPEAWAASRENLEAPDAAMARYSEWIKALPGKPVFVAYPVTFDFMFVFWYLMHFTGESPFGHAGVDIRSYAMGMQGRPWRQSGKMHMPAEWFDPLPQTHKALDDALAQGALFCNMLAVRAGLTEQAEAEAPATG